MSVTCPAPASTAPRALTYQRWQELLNEAFLRPRVDPLPFTFYLDDEEASRLWPAMPDPLASLAAAVDARLEWSGGGVFSGICDSADRWQYSDRLTPPPVLPVLALTVLAASRMHRDATATSAAYFPRLAEVLRPAASPAEHRQLARQLSAAFDPMPGMWQLLHRWVERRSSQLGHSTIRDHAHFRRIGYALSQAVIRRSDRMRLTTFFRAVDVQGRGVPEPEVLLSYLRAWASRPQGLSEQFCHVLGDSSRAGLLADHVHRLAVTWDGKILTPEGQRRLDLRLSIDLDFEESCWLIPVVAGIEAAELIPETAPIRLTLPAGNEFYEVDGDLPGISEGLAHGLRLRGSKATAMFEARPVIALRQDSAAASWLSVPSVQPFTEHVLLVQPDLQKELEAALKTAAEPGWRLLRQQATAAIAPGRAIYIGVTFSDPDTFHAAAAHLSPALVQNLRPNAGLRPRLEGGLPLARGVARNQYLLGGAPALILPAGTQPRHVEVELDGIPQVPPLLATGFPIPLPDLEPGTHTLIAGGETLQFTLLEGLDAGRRGNRGSLSWNFAVNPPRLQAAAPPAEPPAKAPARTLDVAPGEHICGAFVPGGHAEPILIRRGSSAWLIQRNGQVSAVQEPEPTVWPTTAAMPEPYYFEITPAPGDVWLLQCNRGRFQPPLRLHWVEPHFTHLSDASQRMWAQLQSQPLDAGQLWAMYLQAFGSHRAH